MSKRMRILFTVSVIANVLLLGLLAGMAARNYYEHPWHKTRRELTPETRHLLARAFQHTHREIKPLIEEAHKTREVLVETIAADNFDDAKFKRLAKEMNDLQDEIGRKKADGMLDLIHDLSDEDRKKFSRHLAGALSRQKPPRSHKGRGEGRMSPQEE